MQRTIFMLLFTMAVAAAGHAGTVVETEVVKPLKPTGTLGTCDYKPTTTEQGYFGKLSPAETVTGSFVEPYSIHGKKDTYVSWFAIVRAVTREEKVEGQVRLLLEQKYFDGLTDCHIMLVSVKGDGDFLADADSGGKPIPPLALVRVYGKVVREDGGQPVVSAEYIRIWPWFTFTVTDLGPEDHGNPRWRKLCHLCSGRVYKPYPTEDYYLQVLGDPKDFAPGSSPAGK
jgi:hypothetical protein